MVYRFYVFCLHSKNLTKLCFFRLMQLSLKGRHIPKVDTIGSAPFIHERRLDQDRLNSAHLDQIQYMRFASIW